MTERAFSGSLSAVPVPRLLERLFPTQRFRSPINQQRGVVAYGLLMLTFLVVPLNIFLNAVNPPSEVPLPQAPQAAALVILVSLGVAVVSYLGLRAGQRWAFSTIVVLFYLVLVVPTVLIPAQSNSGLLTSAWIVAATLLYTVRGLIISSVGGVLTSAAALVLAGQPGTFLHYQTEMLLSVLQAVVITDALMIFAILLFRTAGVEGAYAATAQRLQLARITSEIVSRIERAPNPDTVLSNAVETILASYRDVYHVQIFLIDPTGRSARLVASTGDVGRTLLRRSHALLVGSDSVIGRVTATGEAVIAPAGVPGSIHRFNELLPETAVEAAFPLRLGNRVIGALDMQSKNISAFLPEDAPIFQALADNLAVIVDNTRLVAQAEERLAENQRLLEQMRGAVNEVERLNRQLTRDAWSEYLEAYSGERALTVQHDQVQPFAEWSAALREAYEFERPVHISSGTKTAIALPLRVRGEIVGAVEFELPPRGEDADWSDDLALLEAVLDRLGVALDNARLYAETRRQAQREQALSTVSARIQTSNQMDRLLNETARSLQATLGAHRVAIRLGPPADNALPARDRTSE